MGKEQTTLPQSMWSTPVEDLISDVRICTCCASIGIKTIGELYALGVVGRLRIKNFGRKCENLFQSAIKDFLLSLGDDGDDQASDPRSVISRATRTCAELYFKKRASPPVPLDLSYQWGLPANPVVVWLQCADLYDLLKLCRPDMIAEASTGAGALVESKEQLRAILAPESARQAEVALYLIARTLLPIRQWGSKLWLKYIPSWVLSAPIADQAEHAAIKTACEKMNIKTYGDFLSYERYRVEGIGPVFERYIFLGIDRTCLADAKTQAEILAALRERPLVARINDTFENLKARKRRDFEILMDRLGPDGNPPCTTSTMMDKYEITRERLRQIELRIWRRFQQEPWAEFLVNRVVELLSKNHGLIQLRAIEMVEPWFEGVTDVPAFFGQILQRIQWPLGWACSVQTLASGPALVALAEKDFSIFAKGCLRVARRIGKGTGVPLETLEQLRPKAPCTVFSPEFIQKFLAMTSAEF